MKTVLIGVDGATYSVLDPLIEAGLMPNLAGLIQRGARAELRSTAHPLTPPAWTSLMTGMTPGNHGIFDFIRVDWEAETPSYSLSTSADVRCDTVWDIVSRKGQRVACLNFPLMFPAPRINGNVVPGYVPWSYLGRACYPKGLFKQLKQLPGFNSRELSTDWEHERKAVQGLEENQLQDWVAFHITRERRWAQILDYLMEADPSDLTAVLFDGADRIQHLCYHLIDPEHAPGFTSKDALETRELCLQYFRELDGYIGRIQEKAGPEATVLLASDHGFTRASDQVFFANTWLEQNGYLRWKEGVPVDKDVRLAMDDNTEASTLIDWSGTTAFALSSSSNAIHVLRSDGAGKPGVPEDQFAEFRAQLIRKLQAITRPTGEPLVSRVMSREEAFPGAHMDKAPEITLVLSDLSFFSVLRADEAIKTRRTPYGTHHPDGVFIAAGPGIRRGVRTEPLSICDVGATMLYAQGLAVPSSLEGKVPEPFYEAEYLRTRPVNFEDFDVVYQRDERTKRDVLPEDEDAKIRERLKALGYL